MSLTLHFHPLSSFCHKVLIALYENDTPFTPQMVDLGEVELLDEPPRRPIAERNAAPRRRRVKLAALQRKSTTFKVGAQQVAAPRLDVLVQILP